MLKNLVLQVALGALLAFSFLGQASAESLEISYPENSLEIDLGSQILDSKEVGDKIQLTDKNKEKIPFIFNLKDERYIQLTPLYPKISEEKLKLELKDIKVKDMKNFKISLKGINLGLPKVMNKENLDKIIKYQGQGPIMIMRNGEIPEGAVATEKSTKDEISTTNVQVEGVDEGDQVKTDGKNIYYISQGKVNIIQAGKNGEMKLLNSIEQDNFNPRELYISDDRLIIIGEVWQELKVPQYEKMIMPPRESKTQAIFYDIKNKNNVPKELKRESAQGYYVSSRLIENRLIFVTGRPAYQGNTNFKEEELKDMRFVPGSLIDSLITVTNVSIDSSNINKFAFLGRTDNMYMSKENLYLSFEEYGIWQDVRDESIDYSPKTDIIKLKINKGNVDYVSKGSIAGYLINQFSMDEENGNLRVATTSDNFQDKSSSGIYVLDSNMKKIGEVSNIAPGERIYSTRFLGDRAYMVTFKNTDPLFVIDMKNPKKPQILGELKIPGYSTYMHPYDKDKILGFGQDTVEIDGRAYALGIKMALFDVSDVKNPKEIQKEVIGDRGSYSELLYDHKAFLFSKDKNIMGFPVTVTKVKGDKLKDNVPQYGEEVFQGAYIYNLKSKDGFELKAKLSQKKLKEDPSSNIERIIYINDNLYTLSQDNIVSYDLKTFKKLKEVRLK